MINSIASDNNLNHKVIGVLNYNNNLRNNILNRNIGLGTISNRYNNLYQTSNIENIIGKISNVYSNIASKPVYFNNNGLLGYTHFMDSHYNPQKTDSFFNEIDNSNKIEYMNDYQKDIFKKYDLDETRYYYNLDLLPDNIFFRWNGEYRDYSQYISEMFDMPMTSFSLLRDLFKNDKIKNSTSPEPNEERSLNILSIINDFIQYDNIKYAMEKTRIGTINPNPLAALLGATTTNINNYSGKDTNLGNVTNYLYAQTLRSGAQFNSLRRTKYITPDAYKNIGNKLSTIATLSSDFKIDDETGRLIYDFGFDGGADTINLDEIKDNHFLDNYELHSQFTNYYNGEFLPQNDIRDKMLGLNHKFYRSNIIGYLPNDTYKLINDIDNIQNKTWDDITGVHTDEYKNRDTNKYIPQYQSYKGTNINLLHKTSALFYLGQIDTSISRFYTGTLTNEKSLLETAVDKTYGISHGRNLLKNGDPDIVDGYKNPYCRVWTRNHQYNKDRLIRSVGFIEDYNFQTNWELHGRRVGSTSRLKYHSVLDVNSGFVNITPTDGVYNESFGIKQCMFSIENLAWKGENVEKNLSFEQIGPNGGRIMWFPPYDLKFNEQIGVNWNPNDFIGRGEKIYTYTNTERSGTLSFKLLIDHPSVVDMWSKHGENYVEGDDIKNKETLLRFFAGCEKLELKDKKKVEITKTVEKTIENVEYVPEYIDTYTCFYIFFPNNYSGMYDDYNEAIKYLTEVYDEKILDKPIYEDYKWCYRVDKYLETEKLSNSNNYKDNNIFQSNTFGNENKNIYKVMADGSTMSFKHFLETDFTNNDIERVVISAYATNYGKNNVKLIDDRFDFGKKVIKEKLKISDDKIESKYKNDIVTTQDISDISSKSSRCCKIVIIGKVKKTISSYYNEFKKYNDRYSDRYKDFNYIHNKVFNVDDNFDFEFNKPFKNLYEYFNSVYGDNYKVNEDNTISKKVFTKKNEIAEEITYEDEDYKPNSWDEEQQYFSNLKEYDPFLFDKITEKIKYFSPAFHSITPEGFNARLGFLHQCTRQGSTYNTSDNNSLKSAGNLSFGRPPICVLRIGDFYNTKIIITNISINYDEGLWDLNPEGIGVQPMFADISINFVFLGGSDIETPIARLQNALSFNFYANQSIYDYRSDIGTYDIVNSKVEYKSLWKPQ